MEGSATEARKTELLDELAMLEHKQWKSWAMAILDTEDISEERAKRWLDIVKRSSVHAHGWNELTEDEKNQDREWAEQVLWIVKKHMGIK